ncbi:MAG: dolichyl-phosphate-mannose-protein mannosyltransferase protein [Acidobacteria bacterium]|nr:dolichyl-phosphate-mannose-protein mannosyltransferase protein [Acidobacteriota bacterium]
MLKERSFRRLLAVLVAAVLLLLFLQRFVLVDLFSERCGLALLFAAANALAILGAGFVARRMRADSLALDFIVGYPLYGTLCFLVGALRVSTWTMLPLLGLGAMAGVWAIRKRRAPDAEIATSRNEAEAQSSVLSPQSFPPLAAFSLVAIALIFLAGFLAAQAPPTSLDELAYHLAVPHSWAVAGRAIELPLLSHSYFPLGIESADLPLLVALEPIEAGMASHFVHLLAAIAAAMLLFRLARRHAGADRDHSWLAVAAIVATPALALTAGWSLVDWPLLGICAALLLALEDDDAATIAAATAAGLLTKYTFLPFLAVALLLTRHWRAVWPGLLAGSIFFLRNLVLTGNPLAPFLSKAAPHVAGYRSGLVDYLFDGSFLDETLGVALFVLCLLVTGRRAYALLAVAIALFFVAPSSRILLPFLALPALSAVPQLAIRGGVRKTLVALIGIAIVLQCWLVAFFVDRTNVFALLTGRISDAEYLAQARPSFAAVIWLNRTLPRDSRTLLVGLNETYWFERDVRGGGNFDGPRISEYLSASSPEALRERLRRDGITHVAIVRLPLPTRVDAKAEERQTILTPAAQRTLSMMLDREAANVTSQGDVVTVFTLR